MATDNIKDRLLDDLEALRSELSDEPKAEEDIPTLTPAKPSAKHTLKNLSDELDDIIPPEPPVLSPVNDEPSDSLTSEQASTDKAAVKELVSDKNVKKAPESTNKAPASKEKNRKPKKKTKKAAKRSAAAKSAPEVEDNTTETKNASKAENNTLETESKATEIRPNTGEPAAQEQTESGQHKPLAADPAQQSSEPAPETAHTKSPYTETPRIAQPELAKSQAPTPASQKPITPAAAAMDALSSVLPAQIPAHMTSNSVNSAVEDNPFLPKHLRERLNQSKSELMEEFSRSTDALNASSAFLKNYSSHNSEKHSAEKHNAEKYSTEKYSTEKHSTDTHGTEKFSSTEPHTSQGNHRDLINSLVAQYLPIIEAELRKRLEDSLRNK